MLNINNFLKYSIYIGHSALNSLMLSSWFFYKLKKKIWIINIFKTIIFLKLVLKFLQNLVSHNFPFWFINMELDKEYIFKKYALTCGEFSCTRIWVRGFLSNFKSIQKSINKFILKKYLLKIEEKQDLIKNWSITRYSWPRGIFLSNIPLNYIVCKEAGNMQLPVIAMVDTNIKSFLFSYPIPSNDDALDSVCYIINMISKQILLCKYKKMILWYNQYKSNKSKLIKSIKNLGLKKQNKKYIIKGSKPFFQIYKNNKKVIVKNLKNYLYTKVIKSKHWKNLITCKLFNNFLGFKKNLRRITIENFKRTTDKYKLGLHDLDFMISRQKLRLFNKLKNNNYFFRLFIRKNKYKLISGPIKAFSNTIQLKYLTLRFKKNRHYHKKRSIKKFYFNYFVMLKIIRNMRTYHESFFVNKASNKKYISFYQKYYGYYGYNNRHLYDKRYDKNKKWHYYYGFRVQYDQEAKFRWLNNYFNKQFLNNKKLNKTSYFVDSALVVNANRFTTSNARFLVMHKYKRTILNYWLSPIISKFTLKDGFRWYQPKFFHKEDNHFKKHFKWKLPKVLTPNSTLHYYNNWFMFLLKERKSYKYGYYGFGIKKGKF